jgi:hypothetical protein
VEGVQKSFYLNLRSDLGDELTIARLSWTPWLRLFLWKLLAQLHTWFWYAHKARAQTKKSWWFKHAKHSRIIVANQSC